MKDRFITAYVACMVFTAVACAWASEWDLISSESLPGLAALFLLGVFSEAIAFDVTVARSKGYSSITYIPILVAVLLFGVGGGILVAAATITFGDTFVRHKPSIKVIFNVSQWIVSITLAGTLFYYLLEQTGVSSEQFTAEPSLGALPFPFAGMALTFFTVNYLCVAGVIALDSHVSLLTAIKSIAGSSGANLLYGVMVSPVAIAVAMLYHSPLAWFGLIVSVLPLIFIRRSYHTNIRMKQANKDLLKALVKAIETRDPYTSGHSLRVAALAKRIAIALGVSARQVAQVETAALLHDIGKIDAVYTGILRKPDSLSTEERSVMESHVTKGVELLQSLSSLEGPVIAAVRHHHEREDGKGYPDGLTSNAIPLGAKIIKVCDAVDAMLSDRPYRDALSLDAVREQLVTYAGTQFDIQVVQCVISANILQEHRTAVLAAKDSSPIAALDGHFPSKHIVTTGEIRESLKTVLRAFTRSPSEISRS